MRWFRNLGIKKNPDGTDAFVRSAPTNNGTISPSKQDSSNLTIPYKQVKGNERRETNAIAYFRDNRANSLHVDIFGHNWL